VFDSFSREVKKCWFLVGRREAGGERMGGGFSGGVTVWCVLGVTGRVVAPP